MYRIFLSKIYLFLECIIFPFSENLQNIKKEREKKTKALIEDYKSTLEEANLISNKESLLSRKDREKVMKKLEILIELGHIKKA